jgi:DNA-binding NarL/FixJ family response regulator
MPPLRVVVADDDLLVREGLKSLIAGDPELELASAASDYEGLLDAVGAHHPDVVLTDIRMPPTRTDEGIRAAAHFRTACPEVGVIVLSAYADSAYALALIAEGSERRGYLLKERVLDPAQLHSAVASVAAGGSVIDPTVVDGLVGRRRKKGSRLDALSARELETLGEVAQGKTNAAIARSLFVSDRAVEKHINSIFVNLGLVDDGEVHRRVRATLLYLSDQM